MKRTLIAGIIMLICLNRFVHAQDDSAAIAQIDRFLTVFHHAAEVADAKTYFDSLADDAIYFGTDVSERWSKAQFEQFAKPYFKPPSAWVFRAKRRAITLAADKMTAWFDEDLDSLSYWDTRGSGVVSKINGQWRIRQYNMAFTVPNSIAKKVKELVKAIDPAKK